MLPFGLRNAAKTIGHLVAQRTPPSPMNDEFVGMTEYVVESFHDFLAEESESPSVGEESDQLVNIYSFVVRCDQRWSSTQ